MYSLQKSLTRQLMIRLLLVMCGLMILMYFSVRQILQDYVVTRLQHDTESLVSALQYEQQAGWRINTSKLSAVYNRVKSGHYYQVASASQRLSSRSLFDASFPVSNDRSGAPDSYIADGFGDETWLVWFQQVNKRGREIKIWVAEDIRPVQSQLIKYTAYAFLLVLFISGVLIYLQQKSLQQSFRVFELLRKNLSSIRHKETQALGIEVPEEIMPLVGEIESLIDQLRQRIVRTRHAIGNLAHELKRPVQLLSIQRDEGAEFLRGPLEDITVIIERELRRAKVAGSPDVGGAFKPGDELPLLADALRKIYPQIQVIVDSSTPDQSLNLDRDDMLELTGNLLDNACKFAQSRVSIQYAYSPQLFSLVIEDDGPGLAAALRDKIQDRGVRLDENIQGHGLGLSICKDILDAYKGAMKLTRSELGGLKVSVAVPVR